MLGYLKRGEAYRRRQLLDLPAARAAVPRSSIRRPTPRSATCAGRPSSIRSHRGRSSCSATSTTPCSATTAPPSDYQEYVELDDRSPRVLYKLALAHYRRGGPNARIDALQKAIAIDDGFAEAYYLLGLCYRDTQHRDRRARVRCRRSVALAPALVHAREELADLYGRLGRTDERLAQLEALLALDPGAAP